IPPATVEYAVPVNFSFFSREERYSLKSDSVLVSVLPLPVAGRIADDPRVVAHGLALDVAIEPAQARVGEPLDVNGTVPVLGNVALWPAPPARALGRRGVAGGAGRGAPAVGLVGVAPRSAARGVVVAAAGGVATCHGRGRRARCRSALAPGAPGARLSGGAGQPRTGSGGARRRRPCPGAARGGRGERRRRS